MGREVTGRGGGSNMIIVTSLKKLKIVYCDVGDVLSLHSNQFFYNDY